MPISTPKSYSSNTPTKSGLGVSWSGPSVGPFNSGGGGGGSRSTPNISSKTTTKTPSPTHQRFTVHCTGLKPNTLHDFYYEGVQRNKDCIPLNKYYGTAPWVGGGSSNTTATFLTSDSEGKLEFAFHFTPSVEKEVDLVNKVRYELAGDKKFEVRAIGSTASKIVPFTKGNKSLFSTSNTSSTQSIFNMFFSMIR